MRLSKRILSNSVTQSIMSAIAAMYLRLVYFTGRWQVIHGSVPEAYWTSGKPFILAIWHGRLLMMPYCWTQDRGTDGGRVFHMLISAHRDGQLISKTIGRLGLGAVEGSSSKGGAAALKRMMKLLNKGEHIGITPDGPRGPRMRASSGVVALARLSGVPVIPATCSFTHCKVLKTWDRFVVALPFSRGVFVWGEPIEVPRDADDRAQEEYRQKIENALNDLCLEADRMTGLPTADPAPVEDVSETQGSGAQP